MRAGSSRGMHHPRPLPFPMGNPNGREGGTAFPARTIFLRDFPPEVRFRVNIRGRGDVHPRDPNLHFI